MNAIQLLKSQHREVSEMFAAFERSDGAAARQTLFEQIADAVAIHATIEERHFYPAVRARRTEDLVLESLEEHLGIKRIIADLLKTTSADPTFVAKMKVLKEQIEHHVKEEQDDLFPKASKLLNEEQLEAIGQEMQGTMAMLEGTAPRRRVPAQTNAPAAI